MIVSRIVQTRRVAAGCSALVVALGAVACGRAETPAGKPAAGAPEAGPPTVETVRVVARPLNVTLSIPGELTAFQSVAIYPRVTGFVKSITVDRGSRVRAGQLLATLDAPELAAQRAEARSKMQGAESQLASVRAKADADESTYEKLKAAAATPGVVAGNDLVVAQKALESDRAQVAAAQQNVEAARQALASVTDMEGYLRVTAPFDGVVTERNVHPGALIGPTGAPGNPAPMLRVVEQARLRLVVPVPEAYAAGASAGAEVAFSVAAFPGERLTGRVARIAQAVDVSTRTMAVELDVTNADGRLAPGTFCQVQWPVRRATPSLFVPSGSVANTTGRTFLVRIRGGRAEWVDVKTGLASGPLTEVFGDISAGDQIAARGTDEIRPGTEVRAKDVGSDPARKS